MRDTSIRALEHDSYGSQLDATVTTTFGFSALSGDQEKLIRANIEGNNTLGVLPTGGGKSVCFQIPGLVTRSKTLVISPLIALQDDQVQSLRKVGIKAFAMHSGLSDAKKLAARYYFKTAADEPSFLYISPELLLTETFHHGFDDVGLNRVAVDEAHCVSTWGNSFRPDYQRIRIAVQRLRIHHCSAFTATIDPRIERDIRKRIPLGPNCVRVAASPERPNLTLRIERIVKDEVTSAAKKKLARLVELLSLEAYRGPTIVYCNTRDMATRLYLKLRYFLRNKGITPYLFHGTLPYEDKEEALRAFLANEHPVVIATSAFGMGINRANVRQVIHYAIPYTLLDYAQQIGRAGRDGLPSLCTAFFSEVEYLERETQKLTFDLPTYDFVEQTQERLRTIVMRLTPKERRSYDLRKFMQRSQIIVANSDAIRNKARYMNKIMVSLALLQRVGVIQENGDGIAVFPIEPCGPVYLKLLERTEMHARMQVREKERISHFFEHPDPTQQLLWHLLQQE